MNKFKTGAIIYDIETQQTIAKGCSHERQWSFGRASMHAERHALEGLPKRIILAELCAVIVTLNMNENCAISSRPCYSCAEALVDYGIGEVIYPERLNSGDICINKEDPLDLLKRGGSEMKDAVFAREMRIPDG